MSRVVQALRWARGPSETRPSCIPVGRPRGVKAKGVQYERQLARALPMASHGLWWEYEDLFGHGWCQTDLVGQQADGSLVVFEAKLTWVPEAHQQLELLYRPVVELATHRPVLCVAVAKGLVRGMPAAVKVTSDLRTALELASKRVPVVLHWIGQTVLDGELK